MLLPMLMRKLKLSTLPPEGGMVRWVHRDEGGGVVAESILFHSELGQIDLDVFEFQEGERSLVFSEKVWLVADGKLSFADVIEGPLRVDFFAESIVGAVQM